MFISSQLVSGRSAQAWHAARFRPSAPCASVSTQIGSAEHHDARATADVTACSSRRGFALGDEAAEAAGGVGRGGVDEEAVHVVADVQALAQRGGGIAGVERELIDRARARMCG